MNFAGSVRSSVGLLHNGQSWSNLNKKNIPPTKPSNNLVNASIVAFIATVFFVVSFISPYWLQSYEYTYDTFLNMGLWEFCFDRYRHFDFQYDKLYDGCNHVFSTEYQQIREWILPAWLMATQAFMSINLVTCITLMVTLSLVLVRIPLKFVMRHEWQMIGFCFVCEAVMFIATFFSLCVFGSMCWSRDWLLNPNFRYLSWSYAFCVISGIFNLFAGLMLLNETFVSRRKKHEAMNNLQMEPQPHLGQLGHFGQQYM